MLHFVFYLSGRRLKYCQTWLFDDVRLFEAMFGRTSARMHKDRQLLIFNLMGRNNIGYPSTRGQYGHGYPGTKFLPIPALHSYQFVSEKSPNYIMTCGSSMSGWGAEIRSEGSSTKGVWSVEEQSLHINVLDLKACKLGIMALAEGKEKVHIQILTDNTTTCSYINNFGGKKHDLNHLAREIWIWCISKEIHISAAHIPGAVNEEADALSRSYKDDLEWSLDNSVFHKIKSLYPLVETDMFASRINAKLKKYVSFYPDHEAFAVDAFSINWDKKVLYMFPPFSVIPRILQKIQMEQAEVVLVAPVWKTQTWWPHLQKLLCQDWYMIPSAYKVLSLHHKPAKRHPLKHLQLGVFRITGTRHTRCID